MCCARKRTGTVTLVYQRHKWTGAYLKFPIALVPVTNTMSDWLQEVDLGQALQIAMAATNTHFVQPSADVIAAYAADTPTAKIFQSL